MYNKITMTYKLFVKSIHTVLIAATLQIDSLLNFKISETLSHSSYVFKLSSIFTNFHGSFLNGKYGRRQSDIGGNIHEDGNRSNQSSNSS